MPAHPDLVALFTHVEAEAGIALVTIGRRIAAINHHHREAGLASPTARDGAGIIAQMMGGVRREYARKKGQKAPAEADVLKAMIATIEGTGIRGTRVRAILALGMAGAFRRSEIAALQLEGLQFVPSGLRITIPRSKRDQEAPGQVIAIPEGRFIRPVASLRTWLEAAGLNEPDPVTGEPRQGAGISASDSIGRRHRRSDHRQDYRAPCQGDGRRGGVRSVHIFRPRAARRLSNRGGGQAGEPVQDEGPVAAQVTRHGRGLCPRCLDFR